MKDKLPKTTANSAIEDYLEDMLITDEPLACDDVSTEEIDSPSKASKLYHLHEYPSRQKLPTLNDTAIEKPSKDSTVNELEQTTQRHNVERVERLLDDFNRRQKLPKTTDIETIIASESTVLVQPNILQPEIPDVAEEQIQLTAAPKVWIPSDKELLREDWSHHAFQTLLFEVAGLKLALPLLKLGGIHRIDKEIIPLFGKPDWFMGLIPGHEGNINVVDTARWVMPDKYQQAQETGLNYDFIILLEDSNWGLACTHVDNAISLSPENVRWRATAGKRPWLAGMLIDEMCALLDVDTLIYLLEENFPR